MMIERSLSWQNTYRALGRCALDVLESTPSTVSAGTGGGELAANLEVRHWYRWDTDEPSAVS